MDASINRLADDACCLSTALLLVSMLRTSCDDKHVIGFLNVSRLDQDGCSDK